MFCLSRMGEALDSVSHKTGRCKTRQLAAGADQVWQSDSTRQVVTRNLGFPDLLQDVAGLLGVCCPTESNMTPET